MHGEVPTPPPADAAWGAPPVRSAPTAVERTNQSFGHRVKQRVPPSTLVPLTTAGNATGASTPAIPIVLGRWTRQPSPPFLGAVPVSMQAVMNASLGHHRPEDTDDFGTAVNPSQTAHDR